ncbi:MAG TPA: GNAT family N-acetyltransferase [Burkholderiales bacterium]|nr:GNAT family N-acetyltransferase [Burkholderiales bacterium]
MIETAFVVRPVNWNARREDLRALRRTVFIEEQNVPEELEWDEVDERAYHVLAMSGDGDPIGTGRLSLDCQIGRMAVARDWRGRGVGAAILRTLLAFAVKEGCRVVRLHAQTHALGFYERYGFEAVSDEFQEAGIPHRAMELRLAPELEE